MQLVALSVSAREYPGKGIHGLFLVVKPMDYFWWSNQGNPKVLRSADLGINTDIGNGPGSGVAIIEENS